MANLSISSKGASVKMSSTNKVTRGILYTILTLFLVGGIISCGGSSSGPVQTQAPKSLIQQFVAKHTNMVDESLVDYYVAEEKPIVAAAVQKSIDEKKAAGELAKLQNVTFDFSNLKIELVGEKEEYINDRPTKIIKVDVSGSYIMKNDEGAQTITANETIILELENNNWKVTEKINPWQKYSYNNKG